jgi:hypothetical protein
MIPRYQQSFRWRPPADWNIPATLRWCRSQHVATRCPLWRTQWNPAKWIICLRFPFEYCKWSTANMGMFGWGLVLLESKLSWWEWGFCWRFISKTWDMGSDIAMDENEDRACGDLWSKISFYRDSNHPQWMIYPTMNDLLGEEVINAMCVW